MPSKTTKKARRAGGKASNLPVERDDGRRWLVVRDGSPVYPGVGVTRAQAEMLARGLREPAQLREVAPD